MPLYKYKAADASGKIAQGSLQAESLAGLKAALKIQGLFLMKAHPVRVPPEKSNKMLLPRAKKGKVKGGVSLDVIALFTTEMAIMIGTALPIMETLRTLEKQQRHSRFKKVIGDICESVEQGNSL